MKIKTSELTGAALDWAVAKAQDLQGKPRNWAPAPYSTDWSHAGPIIERESIHLRRSYLDDGSLSSEWTALTLNADKAMVFGEGPTPLIAAMRCFVSSKLGDTVDVPEELV